MNLISILKQILQEEKSKRDRCLRIADRKFNKPSAYKSGAVVRCRKGKIWKGIKEGEEQLNIQDLAYQQIPGLLKKGIEKELSFLSDIMDETLENTKTLNEIKAGHYVYRVDSQKIPDFTQNMQTYYHTDDFSSSGQFDKDSKIPKEYTGKITGIYAGTKLLTALYATGNANQTRFVAKYSPGQPTVYFDRQDVPRLKANHSYLTVFDAGRFDELPTGEWFSSDPGHPIQQQVISDPFDYITRAGWHIQQIDDLPAMLKKLKAAGVDYGAEGIDEEEYDAEGLDEE